MAHDDSHRTRPELLCALEDVRDHRGASHSMQDFGSRRLDARTHAGRKDHDVDVVVNVGYLEPT